MQTYAPIPIGRTKYKHTILVTYKLCNSRQASCMNPGEIIDVFKDGPN